MVHSTCQKGAGNATRVWRKFLGPKQQPAVKHEIDFSRDLHRGPPGTSRCQIVGLDAVSAMHRPEPFAVPDQSCFDGVVSVWASMLVSRRDILVIHH